MMLNYKK